MMSTSRSIVKSAIIVLLFTTFEIRAATEFEKYMDLYYGKESFSKNSSSLTFASCAKANKLHAPWERICSVNRINNIFDAEVSTGCGLVLEGLIRKTVIGTSVKVVSFGYNRVIIQWIEKYVGESSPRKVFVWFTITKFDNPCFTKNVEIILPLKIGENPDDALDRVNLVFDEEDDEKFLVAYYNEQLCGNKICKISFDNEGNQIQELKPWFSLEKGIAKEIVCLKRKEAEYGFLVFSDLPESYLADETGSKLRKLDIQSEANSKIIYSTDHDSFSICYYLKSSLSCGRFTFDGEFKMKKSLQVQWKIEDGAMHYVPGRGLTIITYSNSKKCKENELQEHITLIDDDDVVTSAEDKCRSRSLTMPQFFYSEDYKNQVCLLEYASDENYGEAGITRIIRRIPFGSLRIDLHSEKGSTDVKEIPVFFKD